MRACPGQLRSAIFKGLNVGIDFLGDRKSTRLNSSHQIISYAVFCLKKKKRPRRGVDIADDGADGRLPAGCKVVQSVDDHGLASFVLATREDLLVAQHISLI